MSTCSWGEIIVIRDKISEYVNLLWWRLGAGVLDAGAFGRWFI
jgi:hypothetical protein